MLNASHFTFFEVRRIKYHRVRSGDICGYQKYGVRIVNFCQMEPTSVLVERLVIIN